MIMNKTTKMGMEYLNMYPKKLGILTPASSAIDLTIKLGAFPMYVFAPMKTAPTDIAARYGIFSTINRAIA